MNAILQLENLGYSFTLKGDRIRYNHNGTASDPTLVRPLLDELRQRKDEAIQFLQSDLTLFFDGANGGYGWHISRGDTLIQEGYGLVEGTSNAAEYTALIEGLKAAANLPGPSLIVKGDSQLVINQMGGQWQIKNEGLRPLHQQASDLTTTLASRGVNVKFQWIPREQNKQADKLSRKAPADAPESVSDNDRVKAEIEAIFSEPAPEVQPTQAPVESFPILHAGEEWSEWLESNGLEVDHGSNWEWLPHPTKPGQFVVALGVR